MSLLILFVLCNLFVSISVVPPKTLRDYNPQRVAPKHAHPPRFDHNIPAEVNSGNQLHNTKDTKVRPRDTGDRDYKPNIKPVESISDIVIQETVRQVSNSSSSILKTFNYSSFHDAIYMALKNSATLDLIKPLTKDSTTLDCHMPESSIMVSISNFHDKQLMALQHKAMEVYGMKNCLESRFVTVCLDEECLAVCNSNSIKNCMLLSIETTAAAFQSSSFRLMAMLKHYLMVEALKVVDKLIIFDADVLIFRNPWIYTQYRRFDNGDLDYNSKPLDMMWQPEAKFGYDCKSKINAGVLYLRNSTLVQNYFKKFFEFEDTILQAKTNFLDQDYMEVAVDSVKSEGLNTCSFLFHKVTSHCFRVFLKLPVKYHLSDIVTYHANCEAGPHNKSMVMERAYKGVSLKDDHILIQDFL